MTVHGTEQNTVVPKPLNPCRLRPLPARPLPGVWARRERDLEGGEGLNPPRAPNLESCPNKKISDISIVVVVVTIGLC